jgi:hypothetical protein
LNSNSTQSSGYFPPWPISLLALVCIGLALYQAAANSVEINHDVAAYLQVAALLLDGAVPFVDVVEINPPLIWYLSVLPVSLAGLTGLSAPLAAKLLLIAASLASSMVIYVLLIRFLGQADRRTAALAALVPVLMLVVLDRVDDWGQREHLFALAFLPFIVVRCQRYSCGSVPAVLVFFVSLAMGLACALKAPQFCSIWFVAEAYLLFRYRRLAALIAPEMLWVALVFVLYLAHFLLWPELARENFFYRYVPLIAAGYSSYGRPVTELLVAVGLHTVVPVAAASVAMGFAYGWPPGFKKDLVTSGWLMVCATVVMMLAQGKGWQYHAVPAMFGAAFAVSVWLAEVLQRVPALAGVFAARPKIDRLTALLAILILGIACVNLPQGYVGTVKTPFESIETLTAKGDGVLFISSTLLPAYPMLVQTERQPGSRFISTFSIAMLYQHSRPDAAAPSGYSLDGSYAEEEARFLTELASDIVTNRPKLIMIDSRSTVRLPEGFQLPAYVTGSSVLAAALEDYKWIGSDNGFRVLHLQGRARAD